jgi:hypothetical protein
VDAKREGVVLHPDAAASAVAAAEGEGSAAVMVRQESLSPIISPAGAGNGATQRQWLSGATGGKKRGGWGEGSLR